MASLSQAIAARRHRPVVETAVVTGVVALNMVTVNSSGSDERAWCPLHLSPLPGDTVSVMRGPQGVLVMALLAAGLDVEPPTPPPPDESGIATVLATSAHTWLQPIGGFDVPNSWRVLAPLDLELSDWMMAAVGDRLYVLGGWAGSLSDAVNGWDSTSGEWSAEPSMPVPRWGAGVATIGTKLYLAGGYGSDDQAASTLYEWDQTAGTWTTKASMPEPRGIPGAASIGGKLYVAGGRTGTSSVGVRQYSLYEWDQASNAWSTKAPIPSPLALLYPCLVALDDALYLVSTSSESMYRWDQSADAWTDLGTPDLESSNAPINITVMGSDVYFFAGQQLIRWTPSSGEWTGLADPPIQGAVGAVTIGSDIYVTTYSADNTVALQRWTRDGSIPIADPKYVFDWSRTWAQQGTADPDEWIGQICYAPSGLYDRADSLTVRLTLMGAGPQVTLALGPTSQTFPQPDNGFGPAPPQPGAGPLQVTMTPGETRTVDLPASWWTTLSRGGGLVVYGSDVARLAGPDRDPQAGMLRVDLSTPT